VGNVVVDPILYHWEDPDHLLEATEGFGPRTLALNVATSVAPTTSVVITGRPNAGSDGGGGLGGSDAIHALLDNSALTISLGYSVTPSFMPAAASPVQVPVDGFARLEAYTAFQKATWDVMGPFCSGAGISYKPVGVYFKTCMVLAGCTFVSGPI